MIRRKLLCYSLDVAGRQAEIALRRRLDGGFNVGSTRSDAADALAGDGGDQRIDGDRIFIFLQATAFHSGEVAVLVLSQKNEGIRPDTFIRLIGLSARLENRRAAG